MERSLRVTDQAAYDSKIQISPSQSPGNGIFICSYCCNAERDRESEERRRNKEKGKCKLYQKVYDNAYICLARLSMPRIQDHSSTDPLAGLSDEVICDLLKDRWELCDDGDLRLKLVISLLHSLTYLQQTVLAHLGQPGVRHSSVGRAWLGC